MKFQRITFNLSGAGLFRKQLKGRMYTVVPTVMMVEGVWEGSGGAVYYSGNELAKACPAWNHKPIVSQHPEDETGLISAARPEVIEAQEIGFLLNTRWEDEKQKTDSWIDEEEANRIDSSIMTRLSRGETIEVSTGLYFDDRVLNNERKHKGKPYTIIARNHRPDHLAILPDRVGACSNADGAGLNANRAAKRRRRAKIHVKRSTVVDNQMSYADVTSKLQDALAAKFGQKGKPWYGYVCDVYDDYVIYRAENAGMYKIGFTRAADAVTLDGSPIAVEREMVYRTEDGGYVGNRSAGTNGSPKPTEETMAIANMKDFVTQLIANSGGRWTEADREALMGVAPPVLERLAGTAPPPNANGAAGGGTPPPNGQQQQQQQPSTIDAWISQAPPDLQPALHDMVLTANQERARLVDEIVACPQNQFAKADLLKTPVGNLRAIHALIQRPANAYSPGAGEYYMPVPIVGDGAAPVGNYAPAAGAAPANYAPGAAGPLPGNGTVMENPVMTFDNPLAAARR